MTEKLNDWYMGKNGLIKELVGNNSIDNDACETDDVAVFESLRTSLRPRR